MYKHLSAVSPITIISNQFSTTSNPSYTDNYTQEHFITSSSIKIKKHVNNIIQEISITTKKIV